MNSTTLVQANAGSIARLVAGVLGGALASAGIAADDGALEAIIGSLIVAATGIWAIVKNAKAKKAAAQSEAK